MTILYCADIRLPTEKAHGVQIMKMCEAFAELGHDLTLAVPRRHTGIKEDPFVYYAVRPSFQIARLFSIDSVRFWGRIGFGIQGLSFALSSLRHARRHRPDLVYSRDPLIVGLLGLCGVKSLIWESHVAEHGLFPSLAARYAKKIAVISRGLGDFYADKGIAKDKIVLAPDAVDASEFAPKQSRGQIRQALGLPEEKFVIEYVGKFHTMGHPKGVEKIIEVAGQLVPMHPDLFLLVVGFDTHELPLAEEIAARAGLSQGNYRFVPHMPRKEIPRFMHAADLLLMNYPNTPHYARIMSPLKVFEYMASGVPILTTDLPSLREVLDDETAYFISPDHPAALRGGIEKLLTDRSRTERLAQRALEKVSQYSWRSRAEGILAGSL